MEPLTLPQTIVTDADRGSARTAGEQHLFDVLTSAQRDGHLHGWAVYEQPHLNGDRPDFVLLHPERGIVVIEVKDWDLEHPDYAHPAKSPVARLKRYHRNIVQAYSREYLPLEEAHGDRAYAVVETAVYFHHANATDASHFLRLTTPPEAQGSLRFTTVLDRDHLRALANGDLRAAGVKTFRFGVSMYAREGLLSNMVRELDAWMRPIDYNLGRHSPIALDPAQKRHAVPAPRVHRRLKGAAGSGKSVVLASRAAALLEAGQRVLVLTYNITLQHFLRDLIRQQYQGPTSRPLIDDLVILHFHGFLQLAAEKLGVELERVPDDHDDLAVVLENRWPAQVLAAVPRSFDELPTDLRFDAVLIDEGQDFSNQWVSLALRFLTARDEFLIAFDTRQNLYGRDLVWLDTGGDVQGLGFSGPPARLTHSYRLPDVMADVSNVFATRYFQGDGASGVADEPIDNVQAGLFDSIHHLMRWQNQPEAEAEDLVASAVALIEFATSQLRAHPNDLVVLTDVESVALPLIRRLKDSGFAVTHVFDDRDALAEGEQRRAYVRNLKWRFQPADGRIKVCTIHSFKGWEAPYVIGLLSKPSEYQRSNGLDLVHRAAMIYIGLTRLKRSNDGSSSLFAFVNADPRFDDVADIIDRANGKQTNSLVVPRAGDPPGA